MSIPAPPPLRISPGQPAHEVFELQQRRHHQRLNLWAGVMCPIPSCKRYSSSAAHGVHQERAEPAAPAQTQENPVVSPSRPRASSVQYYPPSPVIAPPAYSVDAPVTETGTPLLDITLDKIMQLVLRELGEEPPRRASEPAKLSDLTDGESDRGSISSASTLARSDSKRRKNALNEPDRHPPEIPFEKELYVLLECDVCSMLLYEPVTTPCQHVSVYGKVCLSVADPAVVLRQVSGSVARPQPAMPGLSARTAIVRFVPRPSNEQAFAECL